MSDRVTITDVNRLAASVSELLIGELRVVPERRYGYIGLDLYDAAGYVRTLSTGHTAREAYNFLRGMADALYIVGRG